ncbi:hypothetical protein SB00175_03051 [Klebsiella oxytoca]|nr:hypothetical protein SB00175_03051 [Klebsiella oxytoca]
MLKTPQLRRAKAGGFQQRGVAETIGDNPILFARESGNHRLIRGKAGNKQQRARIAQPVGQLVFQHVVRLAVAADVAGTAAADAVALRALLPGLDDRWMLTEAQIIVAGKIEPALPFTNKPASCALGHRQATAQRIRRLPLRQRLFDTVLPAHSAAAL